MKKVLLLGVALAAMSAPASARLQLTLTDGTTTFTCFDGQAGCDLGGGANNLLTLNTTVGAFTVFGTLNLSESGTSNNLSMSSFGVINNGALPGTLSMLVSDTDFTAPVSAIEESASLTFHNNVGALPSTLRFWADDTNTQGANPLNTPGPLLFTTTGSAVTNPDSFSGTNLSPFFASGPFSMTEEATIRLISGGSITGFNSDMQTSVPEPRTWALMGLGFALMALLGVKRRKSTPRFAL
jgi:hypothetical protein